MKLMRRPPLTGPPLALQIVGLLLGGLVVAQLVTLFLTILLPPEPQPQYGLDTIAQALSGAAVKTGDVPSLQRIVQSGPPAPSGPGWLISERSRHDLAALLGRDEADVQLYFFTPLPFAGTARVPAGEIVAPSAPTRQASEQGHHLPPGFIYADYQVAQAATGGPRFPGGGFPGGFPGGGFPGGGVPGAGFPHTVPGGIARPVSPIDVPASTPMTPSSPTSNPGTAATSPARPDILDRISPADPAVGSAMPAGSPWPDTPQVIIPVRPDVPGGALAVPGALASPRGGLIVPLNVVPLAIIGPPDAVSARQSESQPAPSHPRRHQEEIPARPNMVQATAPRHGGAFHMMPVPLQAVAPPAPAPLPAKTRKPPVSHAMPVIAPARGLFGLAPAPFVEGDFVAALRLADGQWAVVQPTPEPFPNGWQRRVLLWFLFSFALVAPLGWLFARRLVRPIAGFARAAEQLGRDPTAPILILGGPAEVGRAAHAFNRMQSRLRSFVDDRTAMVGAISHDLRTPLTRLRFRMEELPDEVREGMLAEVDEMEEMISSVLAFIRDASEPGSRETLDLRSILEDVVEDAVFVGKPVTLEDSEPAAVEVDPLGMRRVLGNLVENAVKYGDSARVRLFTDRQEAVAEVHDNGPGLPDEELERVFQPFYRAPAARASNKHGTGLGLAVCRSIARAHGGDVQLRRGERGLVAQVRLPLSYGAATS